MRRLAAALVLACLLGTLWLSRSPPPTSTAAAASFSSGPLARPPARPSASPREPPPSPPPRRAPRLLRSSAPARVSGCVVHENGEPADDAVVHIEADASIFVDEDGCFDAEVSPGDYAIWASVDYAGGRVLAHRLRPSVADACADAAPARGHHGRRAPGGSLSLDDDAPDDAETLTDDDGRVVPAREASDWTPLTLAPGEEAPGLELTLTRGRRLAGQTSRDVTICVAPASLPSAEWCDDTDERAFDLGPFPSQPLRLVAREPDTDEPLLVAELPGPRGGLRLQVGEPDAADGDQSELDASPTRLLAVRVTDEHGAPVAGQLEVRAAGYLDTVGFDGDGPASIAIPRDRGCVSVCADVDQLVDACAAVRDDASIALVVRQPTRVHGFVRLPGGAAAAAARIRCGQAPPTRTDARGQFEVWCPRATAALEIAHDGGIVTVPVAFDDDEQYVEIRL